MFFIKWFLNYLSINSFCLFLIKQKFYRPSTNQNQPKSKPTNNKQVLRLRYMYIEKSTGFSLMFIEWINRSHELMMDNLKQSLRCRLADDQLNAWKCCVWLCWLWVQMALFFWMLLVYRSTVRCEECRWDVGLPIFVCQSGFFFRLSMVLFVHTFLLFGWSQSKQVISWLELRVLFHLLITCWAVVMMIDG